MIFDQLLNVFFSLLIATPGAPIEGEFSRVPHQVVENPDPHQGSGLRMVIISRHMLSMARRPPIFTRAFPRVYVPSEERTSSQ